MSIFSKMSLAKKRAAEEKAKKAVSDKPPKAPYRHIPTHAAVDALNGAPSSWKNEDRVAIKKQNKRRSEMSRNSSYLSQTTLQNTSINRNSSYNSADTFTSRTSQPRLEVRRSHLGFQGLEGYESQHPRHSRFNMAKSPLASNQVSPVESSGNSSASSASSQILELPSTEGQSQQALQVPQIQLPPSPRRIEQPRQRQQPQQLQQPYHLNQPYYQHQPQQIQKPQQIDAVIDTYVEPERKVREPPLWEKVAAQQPNWRPATQPPIQPEVVAPVQNKRRKVWSMGRKSNAIAAH